MFDAPITTIEHAKEFFQGMGYYYVTTLIALFWSRWFPGWRWFWQTSVAIIILATLFTGQHYLPDPIGGLALAWFSYHVGLWCTADASQNPVLEVGRSQP